MQVLENFRPETFRGMAFFEAAEKLPELSMSLLVFLMRRAPETFHALFLKLEMHIGVGFEKIDELDQQFAFLGGGIGARQHPFQMIDVIHQHLVVLINGAGTRRVRFIPK
jgi:hypothetical protein